MKVEELRFVEGTISAVEAVRKHRGRVAIFVEGVFAMELGAELAFERRVKKGERLSHERARELLQEDGLRSAFSRSLHLLSYRGRTVNEIRTRLSAVGYPPNTIEQVVEKLERLDYLDDSVFAERYARSRLSTKAHGPRRIQADLRRLGVPEAIVTERVEQVATADEIRDAATRAGAKYWRRLSGESDERRKRWRFVQYLVRRGFDVEYANAAYEAVASEQESE